MNPVRCPKCGRLLGYFRGEGEMMCPRCRKDILIFFDTEKHLTKLLRTERLERH